MLNTNVSAMPVWNFIARLRMWRLVCARCMAAIPLATYWNLKRVKAELSHINHRYRDIMAPALRQFMVLHRNRGVTYAVAVHYRSDSQLIV